MQCKPNSHLANSIRHAYSRYEYVRANTIWRCDGLTLLANIRSALPICRDNAYSKS
jgi:hypothetical protein